MVCGAENQGCQNIMVTHAAVTTRLCSEFWLNIDYKNILFSLIIFLMICLCKIWILGRGNMLYPIGSKLTKPFIAELVFEFSVTYQGLAQTVASVIAHELPQHHPGVANEPPWHQPATSGTTWKLPLTCCSTSCHVTANAG